MKPEVSLILSIYNKIDVLKLVLSSLEMQSKMNFEVILSDDGSRKESVAEINQLTNAYSFKIKHVWHEDTGWNKNAILNQAIIASETPYLIFVDGDCLLHHKFIEEHFINIQPKTILAGRRVNLSERVSAKLSADLIARGYLRGPIVRDSLFDSLKSKARDAEQGIYITNPYIKKYLNRKEKGVLGSNFSVSKDDLLAVNGFDERFKYPAAGEDSDISARLKRNGLAVKTIRNQAIQFHMYHKELPREKKRLVFFEENNAKEVTYTPFGINKEG